MKKSCTLFLAFILFSVCFNVVFSLPKDWHRDYQATQRAIQEGLDLITFSKHQTVDAVLHNVEAVSIHIENWDRFLTKYKIVSDSLWKEYKAARKVVLDQIALVQDLRNRSNLYQSNEEMEGERLVSLHDNLEQDYIEENKKLKNMVKICNEKYGEFDETYTEFLRAFVKVREDLENHVFDLVGVRWWIWLSKKINWLRYGRELATYRRLLAAREEAREKKMRSGFGNIVFV